MHGLLVTAVMYVVGPWLITAALLFPAFQLTRGKSTSLRMLLGHSVLLCIAWTFCSVFAVVFASSSHAGPLLGLVSGVCCVGSFAMGGFIMSAILENVVPARRPYMYLLVFGCALGILSSGDAYVSQFRSNPPGSTGLVGVVLVAWAAAPFIALYAASIHQYSRLRRHRRGDCVFCGYSGGGTGEVCSECGTPPPLLCSHCRRFQMRSLSSVCAHCHRMLGVTCWSCGYDWAGSPEAPRCPECGVWKPVTGRV